MLKSDEMEASKLERLKVAVSVGAEQAEQGEFVNQTISEVAAEAKLEKHG